VEKVQFATNRAEVLPSSLPILDKLVKLMKEEPEFKKVRIEAHTDNQGNADANLDLSNRRAAWVREYLIKKGIAADRLESQGYGLTRPIADNKTPAGRAINRRVEFVVIEQ
jgi:outer membrane protein OmpA-like peptidoglycan-associated protein